MREITPVFEGSKVKLPKEKVLENVFICLEPKKETSGRYYRDDYLDLQLYFRVYLNENQSFRVPESMVNLDLIHSALENTKSKIKTTSLASIIGMPESGIVMDVMTSDIPFGGFGASALFFEDVFREYCERNNLKRLCILPSSIHELIILDDDGAIPSSELADMIQTVNATELVAEDVLADHPYYYDYRTNVISYI